ncbi:putative MFS family arabinose efflux permease [Actinoplanes tereljensis]|uniref:MFS transporter n=1 Tax=Paractinoplanes tereljensis TaxID=571912 RepID=A0A919TR81_9ACTN|nr:MFS transporter [Actinoplanes tereljensis]GIF17842.1 MFS transporter [Actinoplanes tereljensis]
MTTVAERVLPARLGNPFRWLLASSWTSNFGDGVAIAAGPLLVAALTDDAFLISMAALLRWLPPLLFGLHAGVLSDRHDRRRIIIVADGSRVVVLAALVAALAFDQLTAAGALVALGLLATAEVYADNTGSTLAPMLVHRDDLPLANARMQFGFLTLNQLAGPPLGAFLFAVGYAWPFVGQAFLVFAGVLLVARVRLPAATPREASPALRDIREGLAWTVRHPAVRTLVLTILIFNVTFGAAWAVLVIYATEQLGMGPTGFGLLSTVSAVGGLLGTGLYGWITARVSLGNVMRIGLIIETLTHLALALTTTPWVAMPVFFVFGAHAFIWGTTSVTVRQRAVPTELQGRVSSVNTIGVFGGLVVGSAIGGTLATHWGVSAPFWFAFAGSAVFLVLLWPQLTRIAHA